MNNNKNISNLATNQHSITSHPQPFKPTAADPQTHPFLQLQQSSSSSYQNPADLMKFDINQLHSGNFALPSAGPSSSAPAHLSLFDFHQDISLYDCLNSQSLPLSAPLPQSIDPSKHHLPLSLEDNSIRKFSRPQLVPEAGSFGFYNDPTRRPSHPSHPTPQGTLNHYSILPQSTSGSELPLAIDQPHPSSATASSYPPHLMDLPPQPTLQNRLRMLDSIETLPSSAQAADTFDPHDIEPTSTTHDSHPLDLPSNSLQALFFNPQTKTDNQMLLEQPFSAAPTDPFDQITPAAVSEKSNNTPYVRSRSPRMKYNRTATSTLSQDFRRRKDWTKRLVEDIEDVILVVTSTGELLFLSESMSRLTGFQTSELSSSKLFDWCFEEEDSVNLKREMKNCTLYGKQLNLYCRFKKKDSDGFIILEMSGHMTDIKAIEEETGNGRAVYITGRLYPTSCGRLIDNFLELMIENEMMMRKLRSKDKGSKGWSEGEEVDAEEPDEGARRSKNKRRISEPTKVDPVVDEDEESEEEQDQSAESISHQIIGRDFPSRPRKRPKKDKIDFLCLDCGVTQSPEWRKGPMGRKTLCNACGLRYAKKGQVINNNMVTNKT